MYLMIAHNIAVWWDELTAMMFGLAQWPHWTAVLHSQVSNQAPGLRAHLNALHKAANWIWACLEGGTRKFHPCS